MKGQIHRSIISQLGVDEDDIVGLDTDIGKSDVMLFGPALLLAIVLYEVVGGLIDAGYSVIGGLHPLIAATQPYVSFGGSALAGIAVVVGAGVAIVVSPEGRNPGAWLADIWAHKRRVKELSPFEAQEDDRPESLTAITRFHPDAGVVERIDGALVAIVSVEPANMALATDDEWDRVADEFGAALNTLAFPVQIRTSARPVDPEDITAPYATRRDDPDVKGNEALEHIVNVYQRRLPDEFDAKGTSVRDYHVIIPVAPKDVQLEDDGAASRLSNIPKIGGVIETILAEKSGMDEVEIQTEQRRELADRVGDVREAVDDVKGCSAEAVGVDEAARLIEEYWTGKRTEYQDGASVQRMRSFPVVRPGDASERD